jgi:hypothetical protein
MGSTEKRPALSQALLEKLIYIENHKGVDGWTPCPVKRVFYRCYRPVIANIHPDLFVLHPSGDKVKLSEGGSFLVKWCR